MNAFRNQAAVIEGAVTGLARAMGLIARRLRT